MKSGTENKLKFKQLQRRLELPEWGCEGLLSALWRFTRISAPDGNLGKFTPEEIAIGIDWRDSPETLIVQLVETKWLDRIGNLLLVHDWWDHCEDNVHRTLARGRLWFACGKSPKLNKLEQHERKEAIEFYETNQPPGHSGAPAVAPRVAHGHVPSLAQPSHTRPSLSQAGELVVVGGDCGRFDLGEERRPEFVEVANRIHMTLFPAGKDNGVDDRRFVLRVATLRVYGTLTDSVFEGALAALRETKVETTPKQFFRGVLITRCRNAGIDERLIDCVGIPPWAMEMISGAKQPTQTDSEVSHDRQAKVA